MQKMSRIEKIKEKNKTVYQRLAEKHSVTVDYVGKIARSDRRPTKKKGLAVKKDLEKMLKE